VPEVLARLGLPEATPATVRPLPSGAYHRHAVLATPNDAWLLRACTGPQWGVPAAAQLTREHATLRALEPTGVAPRPVALLEAENGAGAPVLVEELVSGRHLDYARDMAAFGAALAQVHALTPLHLPRACARDELLTDGRACLADAHPGAEDEEAVALVRRLEAAAAAAPVAPSRLVLVHTDLNAANLLVDRGARILDWDAARLGPPEWDLAHALSPTTTHWDAASACTLDPEDCEALLEAYVAAAFDRGAAAHAVARVPALLAAVAFRALAWCLGFAAQARAEGLAVEPRLAEALQRYRRPEFVEHCLDVVGEPVAV
jgi:aminoglycoside phosphotransferase (APT) family kinase protein